MPSYATVVWQPDDEVTSDKLQQMCQNTDWLKDRAILGNVTFQYGNLGQAPFGRTPGTMQANREDGLYIPFDSQVPVSSWSVDIPYPVGYTVPPICVVTIAQGQGDNLCGVLTQDASTAKAIYRVFKRDGSTVQLRGALNVMLFGR